MIKKNSFLYDQVTAVVVAVIFAIWFILIDLILKLFGISEATGSMLIIENKVPVTSAILGCLSCSLYSACVFLNRNEGKLKDFAKQSHLFLLSALWLTSIITFIEGWVLLPLGSATILTLYLWLMSWVALKSRENNKLMRIGYFLTFLAFILTAIQIVALEMKSDPGGGINSEAHASE